MPARWRARLAGAWWVCVLWLGFAAGAWAQTSITLGPLSLADGEVGVAYSDTIYATGGSAPYVFTVTGSLPPGLSLDLFTGTISGTPSSEGSYPFTITAVDSGSSSTSKPYQIDVYVPATIVPADLPGAQVGRHYTQYLSVSNGGTGPYHFTVVSESGSLPPGLTLDAGGTISGTPEAAGYYGFKVNASPVLIDEFLTTTMLIGSITQDYMIEVEPAPIILTPLTLPSGQFGLPYSATVSASGGNAPYSFYVTSGALPDGLVLDPDTGEISGTPTSEADFDFEITAMDAYEATGSRHYYLTIAAPTLSLSPATLPDGTAGVAYDQLVTVAGSGSPPYYFQVVSGALPYGLSLASAGTDSASITGIPETPGSYSFVLEAKDSLEHFASQSYVVEIANATIVLSPSTLPDGQVGVPYSQVLGASGGTAPYAFVLDTGTLPAGLVLSSDGTLDGVPTEEGSNGFRIAAIDANGSVGHQDYGIAITSPTITLTPATLPDGTVGVAYAQSVGASGGTAPYVFEVSSGLLPPGLVLDSSGSLSGTPTTAGGQTFKIRATDALGSWGEQGYDIAIAAPTITLTPATLPDGEIGAAYAQTLGASGGTGPYAFAVSSGALPPGLVLSSDGTLSGKPDTAGGYLFTVTANDIHGDSGHQDYGIAINAPTILVTPASLPDGEVGVAYSQALGASGGSGPYAFAVSGGELPAGLALSSDGTLSGTPTTAGSHGFTVTATDTFGNSGDHDYAIAITSPTIVLSPSTLPDGVTGVVYAQSFDASGGTGPYAFIVSSGDLPPGLALASDGDLSGTPTTAGSYGFTVTATDTHGNGGSADYAIEVASPTIVLSPSTLPGGQVGVAYAQQLDASGGTGPYTFKVSSGTLPPGVLLASDGTVSGTPTTAGSFSFTVGADDTFGNCGVQEYTIEVTAPTIVLSPSTLPDGVTRVAYAQTLDSRGGS
jgi:hypothetical protein